MSEEHSVYQASPVHYDPSRPTAILTQGDIRPVPDPTVLSRQATEDAKAEMRREIRGLREILEARLEAMGRATDLLREERGTERDRIDAVRIGFRELHNEYVLRVDERFRTIDQQFSTEAVRLDGIYRQLQERDQRTIEARQAAQEAITAALRAQRDMVDMQNANIAQALERIEASAAKQIEAVGTLMQTNSNASNDKIEALKERVTLIEGRTAGITAATHTQQVTQGQGMESSKFVVTLVALGVTFIGLLLAIGVAILKP